MPFSTILIGRLRSAIGLSLLALAAAARGDIGPIPMSLKGVPVPDVPGLYDGVSPIIVDRETAIALGKALFWDSNVGSDGMACASCHFHAGADRRVRNQLAPGGKHSASPRFEPGTDGLPRSVNQTLRAGDFPFTQANQPLIETALTGFARISDDVTGSGGSFGGTFKAVDYDLSDHDDCTRAPDGTYHVAGVGTRRVVERNAPTVINAVFNHRLLWDGRASNVFNGSSAGGPRDPRAGVWVLQADGTVLRERLALANAALASQAMTAPVNDVEMSCRGRTLADVGRKLLYRKPLADQVVHARDSVLGKLSVSASTGSPQPGLVPAYVDLVKQAFHPRFWSSLHRGTFGRPAVGGSGVMAQEYSQIEANFSLFFGLALQAYQSTLVSDDSPFDRSARDARGLPVDLTPAQLRGLQQFRNAHCALCHVGPAFTSAAVDTNAALVASHPGAFGDAQFRNTTSRNVVSRMAGQKGFGFVDTGFAATGVGADGWDLGLAGKDEFGNELALAAQYLQSLVGNTAALLDPRVAEVRACDLPSAIALDRAQPHPSIFTQHEGVRPQPQATTGCLNPSHAFLPTLSAAAAELASLDNRRMLLVTDAAFKIPTLRNVELTGPYMHNGSMSTLGQVIEFYARGGNFTGASKQFGTVFAQPDLQLDAQARADLLAFLQSLTDERVRYERAPFDHPALKVPHGQVGGTKRLSTPGALGPDLGQDRFLALPAVGAAGRVRPLQAFSDGLAP